MRTIKLVVAYDGSCYHGFQKQKDYETIQSILEEKLAMLCGERRERQARRLRPHGRGRARVGTDCDLYYQWPHSLP